MSPTSYQAAPPRAKKGKGKNHFCFSTSAFGGDDRTRTGDLLLAKQALSQLSYAPSRS